MEYNYEMILGKGDADCMVYDGSGVQEGLLWSIWMGYHYDWM